jgi:hypothetical protein
MLMRLVNVQPDLPGSFTGIPRGSHRRPATRPRWPGLWPRLKWPQVERGILLWQDGRVMVVESWDDYALYHDADDQIAGGYVFETEDTSWQYTVLTGAGFTFEPV